MVMVTKGDLGLADPCQSKFIIYGITTLYSANVDIYDATRTLVENSPLRILSQACIHGLLSVRICVGNRDSRMYGPK